jgi:aspartate aminotransferase
VSLSQLARSIPQSPTLKLNETAALLREKGEPVIHLGGGEPKSRAPLDAIVNCTAVLNTGEVRYAAADGIPTLKKAIVRYTEENYNKIIGAHNAIVSNGAKQALMVLLHAILEPKEEVIYPAPYWVSYPEMIKIAGGVPVAVHAEDGGFHPSIKEIEAAVGSYTKAVIINSPNNPSGVMYSDELISDIVQFCEKRSLYLIMDDTYNRLIFDGRTPTNCYQYTRNQSPSSRLVVINCVSKMYAMTGFRIGWAVSDNTELIEAMGNIQGQQTSGSSVPAQWAAVGALNGVQSCIGSLRMTLENNRNVLMDRLRAFDGVKVTKPDGTFYTFPDFSAYMKDSQKLAKLLLDKVRVVTVPGKEFGMEGHLRISFCGTIKEITEGLDRIKWALDPNSPNELYIGDRKLVRDWQ